MSILTSGEKMVIRFLEKEEYINTRKLMIHCFGNDEEFMKEYYSKNSEISIYKGRVVAAVMEETGEIVAMAHVKYVKVYRNNNNLILGGAGGNTSSEYEVPEDFLDGFIKEREEALLPYVMCVGTHESHRRQGLMDTCLGMITDALEKEGYNRCFLVAENKEVYRHLGFIYDWRFHIGERDLLLAEEHNTECSGKIIKL